MSDVAEADQPDNSAGCMIALYPPGRIAKALALPGGLPASEIHLTVVYAGDAADVDQQLLEAAVRQLAVRDPVKAVMSGHARFTGGDSDVLVALADSPALERLRCDAMDLLAAAGVTVPRDHGFTPHLTMRYVAPDDPDPRDRLASFPVTFTSLSVVHGKTRTNYPFGGPLAAAATEAFAAGWALSGGPLTEQVAAARDAAVSLALENRGDPRVLEATLNLGSLAGTWAAVFQRREAAQARHVKTVGAAWRKLAKRLSVADLLTAYRRERLLGESDDAKPTQKQKDAAKAALLVWLLNILHDPDYRELADAITTAMAEAIAEGKTSALAVAADQAGKAGFDWRKAYDAMRAAVTDAETQGAADAVTQQIMQAVAADAARILAKLDAAGASDTEIAKALEDEITAEGGAAELAADTASSRFWAGGQIDLAADEGILLDWLTAADGRVCPSCQANEDNGPYMPENFPFCPDHPRCRCCPTPAVPMRFTAFSAFLVPPG